MPFATLQTELFEHKFTYRRRKQDKRGSSIFPNFCQGGAVKHFSILQFGTFNKKLVRRKLEGTPFPLFMSNSPCANIGQIYWPEIKHAEREKDEASRELESHLPRFRTTSLRLTLKSSVLFAQDGAGR